MTDSKPAAGTPSPGDPNSSAAPARHPSHALVDDLFDAGAEVSSAQGPLDPEEFSLSPPTAAPQAAPVDAPTERIDLISASAVATERAIHPPDAAPSPVVLHTMHPPFGAPQELDLGFPLGSGPGPSPASRPAPRAAAPPPIRELGQGSGILGLPLGSRPAAAPLPTHAPRLPCTVVVVAEARSVGGQIAGSLMGDGYTCRAAAPDEAASALAEEGVQVAVVDLPVGVSEPSQILNWAQALGGWSGPIVWLSDALDSMSLEPGARVLSKPLQPGALSRAIEGARDEALLADAVDEANYLASDPAPLARLVRGESLAQAGHVELSAHVVRALMVAQGGSTGRGQVRSMSPTGQMLVDLRDPPKQGTLLNVEFIVVDGRRSELGGQVARSGEGQVVVDLEVPEAQAALLRQFIAEAQDLNQPAIEQVRIRERGKTEVAPVDFVDDKVLAEFFDRAAAQLDDDTVQQAFIQACIKAQRLPFAVQCYRELKKDRPDDERVAKYLNQVGTILGFYAFRKADEAGVEDGMPRALKWALGSFILAALVIWVVVEVLSSSGSS